MEKWRDGANLKILIAFCLFVSSAGDVGARSHGGKLITEEEEEEEEEGYDEEGVMGYVDYFAPTGYLTCTGHDRFPFAQHCVCM